MESPIARIKELIHGSIADHANECAHSGSVESLWKEVSQMRERITTLEKSQAEERGAAREAAAKNVRTVQLFAGISTLATVVGFVLQHLVRH
jgi:hypothetical protein